MVGFILFGMPGGWEMILIFLAILLLFGGKKIPELMRGIGKGIREFNSAKANIKDEIERGMQNDDTEKEKVEQPSKSPENSSSRTEKDKA